jgi:hypothetical protein
LGRHVAVDTRLESRWYQPCTDLIDRCTHCSSTSFISFKTPSYQSELLSNTFQASSPCFRVSQLRLLEHSVLGCLTCSFGFHCCSGGKDLRFWSTVVTPTNHSVSQRQSETRSTRLSIFDVEHEGIMIGTGSSNRFLPHHEMEGFDTISKSRRR